MTPQQKRHKNITTLRHARELRKNQTPIEAKLWQALRNRQLDQMKFRRQAPVGPYIADFFCAEAKLILEIDGDSHALQVNYDELRTDWLRSEGYHVMRFTNQEVIHHFDEVLIQIAAVCKDCMGELGAPQRPSPLPSPKAGEGENPPISRPAVDSHSAC